MLTSQCASGVIVLPRQQVFGFARRLRVVPLVLAIVGAPLLLVQSADAAGSFVPISGNQVQINFTSMNDPGPSAWFFVFSGASAVGGSCPSGGTLATGVGGNPSEVECSFGAATTSGVVTIALDVPYSCTSMITNWTSSPAAGTIQEPPITCSSEQTTTTTTVTATTTSTTSTTTTQPTATTTTLPSMPCKCDSVFVSVARSGVTYSSSSISSGSHAQLPKVTLKVNWTLVCTQGVGRCTVKGSVNGPAGGSTTLYLTHKTGGSGAGSKQARRASLPTFYCSGPCGGTSHGSFYVEWKSKSGLASKTFDFTFVTHCSGQTQTQTISLLFGNTGKLDRKGSQLGEGKIG